MPQERARPARSAGVLLHPTSLPGPFGIGDLGPAAYRWVDALRKSRQTWWQILPLGPTGYGDSPYQSFSAFAGNPNLISPEFLIQDGLLTSQDVAGVQFSSEGVDFGSVIQFKVRMLEQAWERFRSGAAAGLREAFDHFRAQHGSWLEDYALFRALKDKHGGACWQQWEKPFLVRQPEALAQARGELEGVVGLHQFQQFLFFRQWLNLKGYARQQGIRILGDLPIFVSSDSADVWANPNLFMLDEQRRPSAVAGVPPDYFSETGQLWGNPLYHWEAMKQTGYSWWVARLRTSLEQVDLVRIDHFRGFQAYWEIPAGMPTAQIGRWVEAPGEDLFAALKKDLGRLPLVAEDLGIITPEVEKLRNDWQLPGMRVLQFAFDKPENRYLPHHYDPNTVVYTGTHDNDTTHGWYATISENESRLLHRYVPNIKDIGWDLMRLAWSSVADYAIAPLQDVLSLGTEARMNLPGRPSGNWSWRFQEGMLTNAILDRLADLTELYSRGPAQ